MCIIEYKEGAMKRRDLIKKLESIGFTLERNGANHDVYRRGNDTETLRNQRAACEGDT